MFLRPWELKQYGCGGGVVRTAFRMGARWLKHGTRLSAGEIMAMNSANRMALIERGSIAVWPKGEEVLYADDMRVHADVSATSTPNDKRYSIHIGGGRYDVIEGRKLNETSLSREDAQVLTEGTSAH